MWEFAFLYDQKSAGRGGNCRKGTMTLNSNVWAFTSRTTVNRAWDKYPQITSHEFIHQKTFPAPSLCFLPLCSFKRHITAMAYHPHLLLPLPPTPAFKESLSSWAVQLCVAGHVPLLTTRKVGLPPWMWWEGSSNRSPLSLSSNPHPQLRAACEAGITKEKLKEHMQTGPSARDLMQMLSPLGQGFCGLPVSDRTLRRMFDFLLWPWKINYAEI